MGMITGVPYAATASALTTVSAFRLAKKAVADAIAVKPDLVMGLEALAQRGQNTRRSDMVAHEDDHLVPPEIFLKKLRGFLKVVSQRS